MQRILNYFIAITTLLLINANNSCLYAQENQEEKTVASTDTIPFWQGFRLEVDIAQPLFTALGVTESYTFEGALIVNLKQKYMPVFELGVAGLNNKESANGSVFSTNGMFMRFGVDYNMIKYNPQASTNNFFVVGLRLGHSTFSYDLNNVVLEDPYWGGATTENYPDMSSSKFWFEIVAGLKVEVVNNVYLGWSIRNKGLFKAMGSDGGVYPYFIPGYGVSESSNWMMNYIVSYSF